MEVETPDRLSDLPNSLKEQILSFLPMKEAVRTNLLSKEWKGVWAHIPWLGFDNSNDLGDSFSRFVTRFLSEFQGPKIFEFVLSFMFRNISDCSVIESWLQFAQEKQMEVLFLDVENSEVDGGEGQWYCVPERLYECSSLTELFLMGSCKLEIPKEVYWLNLKCLTIHGQNSVNDQVLNHILCGSPQLEELDLHVAKNSENLNVSSSSLKTLTFFKERVSVPGELNIRAPQLEKLGMSEHLYFNCVLLVPSLRNGVLAFDDGCKLPNTLQEKMLSQVMCSISHAEDLSMCSWCTEVLLKMKMEDDTLIFSNVKKLEISSASNQAWRWWSVLDNFPELNILILNQVDSAIKSHNDNVDCPSPGLKRMRKVVIKWNVSDKAQLHSILEEFLGNAAVLERMDIILASANNVALNEIGNWVKCIPKCSAAALVNVTTE